MDALMDSLNDSIPMPFGVRRLHTPNGKTPIRSIDELQPHGRYIAASSTRRVQGVDLEAIERRKRHREDAQRRWNFQSSPTTTHGGSANTGQIQLTASKGGAAEINTRDPRNNQDNTNMFQSSQVGRASRSRSEKLPAPEASTALSTQQRVNSTFMPVTSKQLKPLQIYFVLNGNPHRFYRTLVSPLSRGELDHLLEEISEGLHVAIFRIYSFEGDRILNVEQLLQLKDSRAIAVPRHERLQLNGQTNSDILRPVIPLQQQKQSTGLLLPPIKNGNNKSKGTGTSSSKSVPPYRGNHSKSWNYIFIRGENPYSLLEGVAPRDPLGKENPVGLY
ncbi:unnamed protein product [Meloidogyne enterolobii]|uniref:Uncharacterized protein n=1 Tax=Meloidogyne enterolobii TaxID=390850 RepID=A0ACB1AXC6_MELEN